jgi:hypothetical protein
MNIGFVLSKRGLLGINKGTAEIVSMTLHFDPAGDWLHCFFSPAFDGKEA